MLFTLQEINAALDRMTRQSEARYRALRHEACFAIAYQHTKDRLGYVDINATYAQYDVYAREYDDMQILHECLALRLLDPRSPLLHDCVYLILKRHLPPPPSVEMVEEALAVLRWVRLEPGMLGTCESQAQCSVCLGMVFFGARIIQLQCDHWFHPMCILEWLREKRSCPLCRQMVLSS